MEWIPVEERRLLVGYVRNIERIGDSVRYEPTHLIPLLHTPCHKHCKVYHYFDNDKPDLQKSGSEDDLTGKMKVYLEERNRIYAVNHLLHERGLIKFEPIVNDSSAMIELTYDGLLLGRRLSTKWGWFDTWYRSHKDGVLGILFALLGGLVGGVITHLVLHWVDPPAGE